MALDLRKNKTPVPNPAPAQNSPIPLPPMPGGLPMPAGAVLKLTQTEREQLEALGWKDGDPVPNIADAIAAIQNDAASYLPDPNMPQVPMPKEIDIRSLSPERRAALQQEMQKMMADDLRLQQIQAQQLEDPTNPEVNRQIESLLSGNNEVKLVPPTPRQETSEPAPAGSSASMLQPAAAAPQASLTGADMTVLCRNCNHVADKDPIEVTEEDKKAFVLMMITGKPFVKQYDLLNGAVQVIFRSLSRVELDLAVSQTGCDMRDNLIASANDFLRTNQNYEMAMSLRRIQAGNQTVRDFEDSLDTVKWDAPLPGQPLQTVLKTYAPYVMEAVGSASTYRLISQLYVRFYTLLRRLEENCFNADFWKGIDT